MKKKTRGIIIWAVIGAIIIGSVAYSSYASKKPGELDTFAQCIADSDTTFYGAFWCPNCLNQKRLFGNSEKILPYVECSTPDKSQMLQVCVDAGIKGYPTWDFPDGSRLTGEISLEVLAEKTGCKI